MKRSQYNSRTFRPRMIMSILVLLLAPILATHPTPIQAQSSYPYNATSCEQCHSVPSTFGSSKLTVQRTGTLSHGQYVPGAEGGIRHRVRTSANQPAIADQVAGQRVSLNLLGDGFIESIDPKDIRTNSERQRHQASEIQGSLVSSPILESDAVKPVMEVGRFGWKAQHASLLSSCADSMRNELGIRNRFFPEEYTTHTPKSDPTPFDKVDPKTGSTELDRLVERVRHTPPPPRDEALAASAEASLGEQIFSQIGCAMCHVPSYRTLAAGSTINGGRYRVPDDLGAKIIHPYSDFLLHDIGTGDGIPQAARPEYLDSSTADKFRTALLWGLRFRSWMMHDGKSLTYHQAIMRHAGEAIRVRERYEELTPLEKQQLRAFLNSL